MSKMLLVQAIQFSTLYTLVLHIYLGGNLYQKNLHTIISGFLSRLIAIQID